MKAAFLCADSVIQGGDRSREVCGFGEHWEKRHGRSFNDNPKWKRSFASDFANLMELLGGACCLSCLYEILFPVDAQQLVAVDHDSRMRRSLWISGANVNEVQYH